MVRRDPTAEVSLAAMRERSRFGMAMAAMMRMMATTINSSMREKPFWFFMLLLLVSSVCRRRTANQCMGTGGGGPLAIGRDFEQLAGRFVQYNNLQFNLMG